MSIVVSLKYGSYDDKRLNEIIEAEDRVQINKWKSFEPILFPKLRI